MFATTTHVRGREVSPVRAGRTRRRAGTRVELRPDVKMFGQAGVPLDALARRLDELGFLLPALRIAWRAERPTLAARGLRGMVARPPRVAAVATHRRGSRQPERLVAAVSVMVAEPRWSNATRDRLVTPAAVDAVAETTALALGSQAAVTAQAKTLWTAPRLRTNASLRGAAAAFALSRLDSLRESTPPTAAGAGPRV